MYILMIVQTFYSPCSLTLSLRLCSIFSSYFITSLTLSFRLCSIFSRYFITSLSNSVQSSLYMSFLFYTSLSLADSFILCLCITQSNTSFCLCNKLFLLKYYTFYFIIKFQLVTDEQMNKKLLS